jgi:gluconokinase
MVLMGVSGCGKTAVGKLLAERLGVHFVDGDDLHPAENVAKMSRGQPLTDADRWPWLTRIGRQLAQAMSPTIVGCSALKRAYRSHITHEAGAPVLFIHLAGSREVIEARMKVRKGHFMPASQLANQFATLEPPGPDENAIAVDIDQPLDGVVDAVIAKLRALPQ